MAGPPNFHGSVKSGPGVIPGTLDEKQEVLLQIDTEEALNNANVPEKAIGIDSEKALSYASDVRQDVRPREQENFSRVCSDYGVT
jgi:hypothetical protein